METIELQGVGRRDKDVENDNVLMYDICGEKPMKNKLNGQIAI